jgi:hypothetical protein
MTDTAYAALSALTGSARTVGLDHVVATASLQTRMDRKYLVPADVFARFAAMTTGRFSVLDIEGRRLFRYESVYFDTGSLTAYRQHAHGRRRRFKVRTRTYLDTSECAFEVKVRGGRGETIKERYLYDWADRARLTEPARRIALQRLPELGTAGDLDAVITTAYRRATFLDPLTGSRLTCDVDMVFSSHGALRGDGVEVRRDGPTGMVLVESKTVGVAALADRLLWQLGQRPVSLSKYCVGMALVRPDLPANRWNRELRRHFEWTPQRNTAQVGNAALTPAVDRDARLALSPTRLG